MYQKIRTQLFGNRLVWEKCQFGLRITGLMDDSPVNKGKIVEEEICFWWKELSVKSMFGNDT